MPYKFVEEKLKLTEEEEEKAKFILNYSRHALIARNRRIMEEHAFAQFRNKFYDELQRRTDYRYVLDLCEDGKHIYGARVEYYEVEEGKINE